MRKRIVILLVLVLFAAIAFWYIRSRPSIPVITEIERELAPPLFYDFVNGKDLESTYAENISFANASVRRHPKREDRLLVDLDVANNGDKTVTILHAYVDFYNRDGRQAAHTNADLGIKNFRNDAPIPPSSIKRATIVPYRKHWSGGKMVVKIRHFETE